MKTKKKGMQGGIVMTGKAIAGYQPRKSGLSYFRQRIMGDEKVKFIYSTKSKVIHDKSCVSARNIPDEYLLYLEEYSPEMSQCSHCAMKAYVRLGARDFDHYRLYEILFKKMQFNEEILRHMYVDCKMQTRAFEDYLMIWDREDIWKIAPLNRNGAVQLLHNNYHLLQDGERKFTRGFHVQSEFTSRTTAEVAIKTIETYSFDLHRASVNAKRQEREQERVRAMQPVADMASDDSGKKHASDGLWNRVRRWFRDRRNRSGKVSAPESYSVQIQDFNLVEESGYPSDGDWCIYVWENKTGECRWQNGVYDAEKGCFVISYKGISCITGKRKVLAWKKLDDAVFSVSRKL